MKKALLKFSVFLLFVFLLVAAVFVSSSADDLIPDGAPSLDSSVGFAIYNIENDRYVISKNASLSVDPASTVKLMSGLIICESLSGRENETVTLTSEMLALSSGKSFGLSAGMSVTVKDLMIAAFSGGYNDAVNALACLSAGSVQRFVEKMNERADSLGMRSTYYVNATGLDDPRMSTTLADTVRLATTLSRFPLFLEVSSHFTYNVKLSGVTKTVYGSNLLVNENSVYFCRTVKGMNSGMTDGGGACAVTYATYGGAEYIAIAMGCPEDDTRFALIQDSLQFVYDNYGYSVYMKKGSALGVSPVRLSSGITEAVVVLAEDLTVFARKDETLKTMSTVTMLSSDTLTAPVRVGDVIGYCTLWDGDTMCGVASVTVKSDIERSAFLFYIDAVKSYLGGRAFIATVILAVLFSAVAFVLPWIALKLRQRKRKYVRTRSGFKLK